MGKGGGVAPPNAFGVNRNGRSKRAVGRPASKPTTRLIGVHCSEQRSTLLRPQQVPWPHSPTVISGRLAAGVAKGDGMRTFKKGPGIPEFFLYQALVLLCFFSLAYTVPPQPLTTGQGLGGVPNPSGDR